jgi:hypothetical protein
MWKECHMEAYKHVEYHFSGELAIKFENRRYILLQNSLRCVKEYFISC